MKNKDEALRALNLSPSANQEEIEKAYRRLVRRYPPEFQPEKFREVDEAYRFLTSLSYQLERLLSPGKTESRQDPDWFVFPLAPPQQLLPQALLEIKQAVFLAFLWGSTNRPAKKEGQKSLSKTDHSE